MKLYLARHGEAVSKAIDPDCPLSDIGCAEIRKMARFMADKKAPLGHVLHSGKARARQSAEIYADEVGKGVPVDEVGGLKPNDDPSLMAGMIDRFETDTMLTGHLPYMARLAQMLTAGSDSEPAIIMNTVTVICLERDDVDAAWEFVWVMDPGSLN